MRVLFHREQHAPTPYVVLRVLRPAGVPVVAGELAVRVQEPFTLLVVLADEDHVGRLVTIRNGVMLHHQHRRVS